MSAAPAQWVHGLVLAGGKSRRMGEDKALVQYHGRSQLHWAMQLVGAVCSQVYVSVRQDQRDEPERARFAQIVDQTNGLGPAGGILAAHASAPTHPWLVVACDLPLLSAETLAHLLRERDPQRIATAFISTHDGLPEPLCAVWEPAGAQRLGEAVAAGRFCPRKTLIQGEAKLLAQLSPQSLDNANTPEEREHISARLSAREEIPG